MESKFFAYRNENFSKICRISIEKSYYESKEIKINSFSEYLNSNSPNTENIVSEITKEQLNNNYIEITEINSKENGYILDDLFGLVKFDSYNFSFHKYIDIFNSDIMFNINREQEMAINDYFKDLYFSFLGNQKRLKDLIQKEMFLYYLDVEKYDWLEEINEEKYIWKFLSDSPTIELHNENEIVFRWSCDWDIEHGVSLKIKNWVFYDIGGHGDI